MTMRLTCATILLGCAGCAGVATAQTDPYAPPASYYLNATGTGATLKSQLESAMSSGHIQRAYGDFRSSAVIHDADPNTPGNIILVYNLQSVSGVWDSGATWNREHVWPQSRQPGSASNSTRGNLGDPHALRPANPSVNSSRGNEPFGFGDTTGAGRSLGSWWFPGDTDKGDIARSLFYSDTRWSSLGISLRNGFPGTNQMGDLASLLAWHYLDTPGEFERRRNHAIFSQSLNPQFYTNNRNAYVDLPGTVWSVYVDQFNDTSLYVGSLPDADGSSSETIDLGGWLVGQTIPDASFTLNKAGADGTYYSVAPSASLVTTHDGEHNAFPILTTGGDSASIIAGFLDNTPTVAGPLTGTVTIDNLDVTTQFGPDAGANDGDDIVTITAAALDHANASFDAASDLNSLSIDLGSVAQGEPSPVGEVTIYNLGTPGYTAPLALGLSSTSGDPAAFVLPDFGASLVGGSAIFPIEIDTSTAGVFEATLDIAAADDPSLAGAVPNATLSLVLTAEVTEAACIGDVTTTGATIAGQSGFGTLDVVADTDDRGYFLGFWIASDTGVADVTTTGATIEGQAGFGVADGTVDTDDLGFFLGAWQQGCP